MQALSAFYSRILPHVPGCSEPLVDQLLVRAAIEFCEATNVLRQDLDPFYTRAGAIEYDLDLPSRNHDLARIMSVSVAGTNISAGLSEAMPNALSTQRAKPMGFYTNRANSVLTIHLYPIPDGKYSVITNVALRPHRAATELDDDLYNIWIDPIVANAIGYAMLIPDQSFTNPAQAATLFEVAARQTAASRVEGNYGFVRGSMRVRSRPFV